MIEYLPLVLTGLGLTASIVYYASILRNANRARERELINQRITMINEEFYAKWRKLLLGEWTTYREYLITDQEDRDIISHFSTMLNSIGLLHRNKMIGSELIFSIYLPNFVIWTWEKVAPFIMGVRESMNNPEHYSGFEYLYKIYKEKYPDLNSLEEFRQARIKIIES
jgi:hypothetical protein